MMSQVKHLEANMAAYPRGKPYPFRKAERNREILRLYRDEGLSYSEIARRYGLSVERVRQIVRDERMRDARQAIA